MKLTTFLLAITPAALACLETTGSISTTGNPSSIQTIDNGLTTCDSDWGWRIDQDGHISLNCLANYIYAVTLDGSMAWYRNPVTAFSFTQEVAAEGDEFWWNDFYFGC
jgi:hypothetical protein